MNMIKSPLIGSAKVASHGRVRKVRFERVRFLISSAMILFATIGTMAAVVFATMHPPDRIELLLLLAMWIWTQGLGSVAFHRYFTHRSFEASTVLKVILGTASAMWFQGPVIYWVVVHRRHHECSDQQGDPHSPQPSEKGLWAALRGFWHGHVGWLAGHDLPNPLRYAPDLLKDPLTMWFNRHYLELALGGLVLPAVIGGIVGQSWEAALSCFLWVGPVRLFICYNLTWSINSLCHLLGSHDYSTGDQSRNLGILAIPTFGESWHNNHHESPSSARFGRRWWQLDLGYLMICMFTWVGLARKTRTITHRS